METHVTPIAITVVIVVLFTWMWRGVNWLWIRPLKLERCLRRQGLRGNSYRMLVGDLKDYSRITKSAKSKPISIADDIFPRVLPYLHHTISNYGTSSFAWNGPVPVVNVTDPELVKEVLNRMPEFPKTEKNPLAKLLAPGLPKYDGEKWAKHRKIINSAFHLEKLKLMVPAFCLSCHEMLNKWEEIVSGSNSSHEMDVWPYIDNLAGDMLSRTAFGSNYEEGKKIFELQKVQADLTMEFLRSVNIPGWRFLPTKKNRMMLDINKKIQTSLLEIIYKKKKAMETGEAPKDDLLGLLMESNITEIRAHGSRKDAGMSNNEVIDECKVLYFVGKESVSSLLVWTLVLLSKHQDWQTRARNEVLQAIGKKNEPDFDSINQLKTLHMILNEVLRLYPPVATLARSVHKDTRLGNMYLPAGVQVQLPILFINHDADIWGDDVLEFQPERFSAGVAKASGGTNTFLPFGWGPRLCIGLNFAMVEAKVAVAMILQRFSIELAESYVHAPYAVKTVQPQHGALVKLYRH